MPLGPRRAATEACACRIPAVTSRIAGSTERASNPRFTQACGCPSPRSLDHVQKVADDLGRICNICSFPSVNRLEGHGTGPRRSQQAEVIRPLAVASVGPVCDDDQGGAEGDDDELSHVTWRSCISDVSDDAHTSMLRASPSSRTPRDLLPAACGDSTPTSNAVSRNHPQPGDASLERFGGRGWGGAALGQREPKGGQVSQNRSGWAQGTTPTLAGQASTEPAGNLCGRLLAIERAICRPA